MATSKKKPRFPCYVCLGNPPGGTCLICGLRVGKKKARDGSEVKTQAEVRAEWLLATFCQLQKYSQATTGDFSLDLEIIRAYGHWMDRGLRLRGLWQYLADRCLVSTDVKLLDDELVLNFGEWFLHTFDADGVCTKCGHKFLLESGYDEAVPA